MLDHLSADVRVQDRLDASPGRVDRLSGGVALDGLAVLAHEAPILAGEELEQRPLARAVGHLAVFGQEVLGHQKPSINDGCSLARSET